MDSYEDYRTKLRQAANYAFIYGLEKFGQDRYRANPPHTWDKVTRQEFSNACHEGFKLSQKLIIEEIKKYQAEIREETVKLKEFRRQRDKENVKKTETGLKIINQRISNFSHVADGIAWQMIGAQIHIARRIHLQVDSSKFLDSSNLSSAIEAAEKINEEPSSFALLSDLTNYIQIGDLLVRKEARLSVVELKEGVVNDTLQNFFDSTEKPIHEITDEELKEKFDEKTVGQAKRMLRQKIRMGQAEEVINTDKGTDPATGSKIKVRTPEIPTAYYHAEFDKLYNVLLKKTWAYNVIEDCIHIGMYRDEGILMAGALKEILKHQATNFIVIDWLSITESVAAPLFAKPLPPELMIDILTGKVKVILGLDLDKLIAVFNAAGLHTHWATAKETAKAKQIKNAYSIVEINKRGIIFNIDGHDVYMSGGILSKIFYDCIFPSNMAATILNSIPGIDFKEFGDESESASSC